MLRSPRVIAVEALVVAVALGLGGCAGAWVEEGGGTDRYPQTHYLTLSLNVSDRDGDPLPGCTVWVDGIAQGGKTAPLFTNYTGEPSAWWGWKYNGRVGNYPVKIPYREASARVAVWVTKSGWENAQTEFVVYDWDERYLQGRATFVMTPDVAAMATHPPAEGRRVASERYPLPQTTRPQG